MTMMYRLVLFMVLLVAWSPASAQPTPDVRSVAKRHFDQAEAYFQAKAFDLAAKDYQAAYELIKEPALLFNIGLALENHGELTGAIAYYDRYLADGTGAKATEAKARRDVLARKLEDQRAAAERGAAERAAAEKLEAERREAERREAERRQAEGAEAERAATSSRSMIPAYASFGVSAVALGVAVYYGTDARSIGDGIEADLATGMPPIDTGDPRFDEGSDSALIANVALATGIVAALAGGYLAYRVIAAKRVSSPIAFVPSVDRDRAGAAVEVRW